MSVTLPSVCEANTKRRLSLDLVSSKAKFLMALASSSTDLAIKSTPLISLASFNKSVFKSPALQYSVVQLFYLAVDFLLSADEQTSSRPVS